MYKKGTDLSKVRLIQKNLVYVIGLSPGLADEKVYLLDLMRSYEGKPQILQRWEYFGQYGNVLKIAINKSNAYNPGAPNGPSYSAYITYSNEIEASTAILVDFLGILILNTTIFSRL